MNLKIFTCYKRNIVAVLVFLLLFSNMGMIDSRAEGNPIDYGETENDTNEGFEFLRDENATVSEPVFVMMKHRKQWRKRLSL